MHLQQNPQAALPIVAGDINELAAWLEGEPEFKTQDRAIDNAEKSIPEQEIEISLGLIRRRHSLHVRFSSGLYMRSRTVH